MSKLLEKYKILFKINLDGPFQLKQGKDYYRNRIFAETSEMKFGMIVATLNAWTIAHDVTEFIFPDFESVLNDEESEIEIDTDPISCIELTRKQAIIYDFIVDTGLSPSYLPTIDLYNIFKEWAAFLTENGFEKTIPEPFPASLLEENGEDTV